MKALNTMKPLATAAAIAALLALGATGASAQAKKDCIKKAGEGIGSTEEAARFQAYEIILQTTGNWLPWLATGKPADDIKVIYKCRQGGSLGWICNSYADVCKK